MKLVDMKLSKAERKAEAKEMSVEAPEYPWGLQIRLENEELKKLGVTQLPEVGGEFHLDVVAKVTATSQQTMADGKEERCVTCQITMLGIAAEESDDKGERETPASESREKRKTPTLLSKY